MPHSEAQRNRSFRGVHALSGAVLGLVLGFWARQGGAEEPPRLSDVPDYHWVKMLRHTEVFDDFERKDMGSFWKLEGVTVELTDETSSQGARGLKVTFAKPESVLVYSRTGLDGWGRNFARSLTILGTRFIFYNEFKFDVFNPGKENVPLRVTVGGPFNFTLKPGWNTITLPCTEIARHVYRMTNVTERMQYTVPGGGATLVFDNFRLERESIGPAMEQSAKCFDFGSQDMCRPGFVAVDHTTGYDSTRGYGWKTPNDKEERDALRVFVSDGRSPLDDLLCDGVQNLTSPFLVDVPNGKYKVLLVGGPRWGGIYQMTPADYDFVVKAEGQIKRVSLRAADQVERAERFYGRDKIEYHFDEDIWRLFGQAMYEPVTFDVEVTDGQLELDFVSSPRPGRGYLNFMVVYPTDKSEAVGAELQRLWYDISNRFCRVSYRPLSRELAARMSPPGVHEELLDPVRRDEMVKWLTSTEPGSGRVLVFRRSSTDPIYPDTVPRPEELTHTISATGFPGQKLQITFDVFALTDLRDVELQLTSLEGPGSIRTEQVDKRVVRFSRRMTGQQYQGDWQYMIVPWYLVRQDRMTLDRGMTRRVSLDLDLSTTVRPGTYRGVLHLVFPDRQRDTVRLSVEVLPAPTWTESEFDRVMVFHHQPSDRGNEAYGYSVSAQNTTGMPWAHVQKTRTYFSEMNRNEMAAEMKLLEDAGFTSLCHTDYLGDCKEASRTLSRPMDLVDLSRLRQQLAGKEITVGGRKLSIQSDLSTSRAYLRTPEECTRAVVDALHREGLKVYLGTPSSDMYMHESACVNRLLSGYYSWCVGADGVIFGPFRSNWGDPYHPFDGLSGEPGSFALPSSAHWPEPNPSTQLYALREGYRDYQYVTALEELIKQAGSRPAAEAAKKFLVELRASLDPDLGVHVRRVGRQGQLDMKVESEWTGERFDRVRAQMIEHLHALSRSMTMPP